MSQDWNNMQNMSAPEAALTDPLTGEAKVPLESKFSVPVFNTVLHAVTIEFNVHIAENEATLSQIQESVISEAHDIGKGGASSETRKTVPVSEFGLYVSKHHANENREFIRKFEV